MNVSDGAALCTPVMFRHQQVTLNEAEADVPNHAVPLMTLEAPAASRCPQYAAGYRGLQRGRCV